MGRVTYKRSLESDLPIKPCASRSCWETLTISGIASSLGKRAKKRRSVGLGGEAKPAMSNCSIMMSELSFAKNHLILTQQYIKLR